MMELTLPEAFEMLKLGEAVQFNALTMLAAAFLANIFVSFSPAVRRIAGGLEEEMTQEEIRALFERTGGWANNADDYEIQY